MRKKIIGLVLILALILSTNPGFINAASGKVTVTVKLQLIDCIENNHVGNEWEFGSTVNNKALTEGKSINFSITSSGKISIISEVVENDSIPEWAQKLCLSQ
jgi:hypothetical protein